MFVSTSSTVEATLSVACICETIEVFGRPALQPESSLSMACNASVLVYAATVGNPLQLGSLE